MVTPTTLQAEILETLYTAMGDESFTSKEGYNAIKSKLPLNSIVQNARDLGALLNACNLKPVGSVRVERAGYDGHKKIVRWRLVPASPVASRILKVKSVLSTWEETLQRPIHYSYKKSFTMAMWWLEAVNWEVERVRLAMVEHAVGSDKPLTAMALALFVPPQELPLVQK